MKKTGGRSRISTRVGGLVAAVALLASGTMGGFAFTGAASAATVGPPPPGIPATCASVQSTDLRGLPPLSAAEKVLCGLIEARLGVNIPPPQPPPGAVPAVYIEYSVLLLVIATVQILT